MPNNEYDNIVSGMPATPEVNEYEALLDRQEQAARVRFNASAYLSAGINPDQRAKAINLAKRSGLPADVVERNLPEVERQVYMRDMAGLYERSPKLGNWLQVKDNFGIAKDDLDALEELAKITVTDEEIADASLGDGMFSPEVRDSLRRMATESGMTVERDSAPINFRKPVSRLVSFLRMATQFGPQGSLPVTQEEQKATEQWVAEGEDRSKIYLPSDPKGVAETIVQLAETPEKLAPFLAAAPEAQAAFDLYGAMTRFSAGEETPADLKLLLQFDNDVRRGSTFMGGVADIVVQLPAFAGELALTGGIYTAARKGVTNGSIAFLTDWMSKVAGRRIGITMGRRAAAMVGAAGGAAVQAQVALAPRAVGEVISRMTPAVGAEVMDDGTIQRTILDPGDGFVEALAKAGLGNTIEVWTERSAGGLIQKGISKIPLADKVAALKTWAAVRWLRQNPTSTFARFTSKLGQASGWNGVLAEIGEEEVAKAVRYATTLDDTYEFTTADEFMQQFVAFAMVPAGGATLNAALAGRYEAVNAQRQQSFFEALSSTVAKSKVQQRLPDRMQSLVNDLTKDGPVENVYIPAQAWTEYFQSVGQDPRKVAEEVLGDGAAYDQAVEAGHDLVIPTGAYAAKIAATDAHRGLADDLRLSHDMMTPREAKAWVEAQAEAQQGQQAKSGAEDDLAADIRKGVVAQLVESGFNAGTAEQYALLLERGFNAMASRVGMSAKDLLERYAPRFVRDIQERAKSQYDQFDEVLEDSNPKIQPAVKTYSRKAVREWLKDNPYFQLSAREAMEVLMLDYGRDNYDNTLESDTLTISADEFEGLTTEQKSRIRALGIGVNNDAAEDQRGRWGRTYEAAIEEAIKGEGQRLEDRVDEWLRDSSTPPDMLMYAWLYRNAVSRKDQEAPLDMIESKRLFHGHEMTIYGRPFSVENGNLVGEDISVPLDALEQVPFDRGSLKVNEEKAAEGVMFQSAPNDEKRGSIRWGEDRKMTIRFTENADLSTFLHESGHMFLEVFADLAQDAAATEDVKADWQTILEFLEVKSRDEITVKHHEKWAETFENYLLNGDAPSSSLRRAFAAFRVWLLAIYRSMAGRRANISDEVRAVMDRMVATQEEIDAAETEAGVAPVFESAAAAGMTDQQFAAYTEAVADARLAAEEEVQQQVMHSIARERKKWWKEEKAKIRQDVEPEFYPIPEYVALAHLQHGKLPDGNPVPGNPVKLSKASLVERYGEHILKKLPGPRNPSHGGPYIYSATGGVDVDVAAELFGFASGDVLVETLIRTVPMEAAIRAEVDRRMLEKYPDPAMDGSISEAAQKAVHGEKRSKVLMLELKHLFERRQSVFRNVVRKVAGGPLRVPNLMAIRGQAMGIVAGQKVRDIKPGLYLRAQARASKAAVEAMLSGDLEEAFKQKQKELLNHELYRAAVEARDAAKKYAKFMRRFETASVRQKIGKAKGDYLEQIDGLMRRYEFATVTLKQLDKREGLRKWIERQKEQQGDDFQFDIDERLLDEADRENWREMPLEKLEAVYLAAKQLEHLADLKNTLLKQKELRDLDEALTKAEASIRENVPKRRQVNIASERTKLDKVIDGVEGFLAAHRKLSSWARQMDGDEDGGVLWQLLVRPLNEAADKEVEMKQLAADKIKSLFDAWGKSESLGKKVYVEQIKRSLNLESRLCVALNWGNEGNRERLMSGEGWDEAQVQAVLDTLDESDWGLVQGIFDMINEYWPEIAALETRVKGVPPEKVEAAEIVTKFGKLAGGYFPIAYDSDRSPKAGQLNEQSLAKLYYLGRATSASTKKNHVKERGEGLGKPLLLSLDVVSTHVAQVIHDLTHREAVMDFNKLLRNDRFATLIQDHMGPKVLREMRTLIQDVAIADLADSGADKFLRWVRNGVSIATTGFSASTAVMQVTGVGQSMRRVGVKAFNRAVVRAFHDPSRAESVFEFIQARSSFMKNRATTQIREASEVLNQVRGNDWHQNVQAWAYYMTTRSQLMIDIPTWLAAYENARAKNRSEEDASAMADQAVIDAQSSGLRKDLSGVQRSRMFQAFTVFYAYFSATYQATAESIAAARRNEWSPAAIAKLAGDFILLYSLPAAMVAASRALMSSGDDDDNDGFVSIMIKEHLSMMAGNFLGIRDLAGAFEGYRYSGPAGLGGFKAASDLIMQVGQGELDWGLFKAAAKTSGILFHLPTGQAVKTIEGIVYMSQHGGDPRPLLFGPPKDK
jgi:hypothetical protein